MPQLKQAAGFKLFDDFDFDYTFIYPRAWVGRRNRQRPGIYLSDFSTADKVTVEEVDAALAGLALRYDGSSNGRPPAEAAVAMAAVASLVNPGGIRDPEIGGDARLYMPAASSVRTSSEVIDGVVSRAPLLKCSRVADPQ